MKITTSTHIAFYFLTLVTLIVTGCSTDKPPQATIDDFFKKKYPPGETIHPGSYGSTYNTISNFQILNQWADENQKGVYYVRIKFTDEYRQSAIRGHGSMITDCDQTWQFYKEGDS